MEYTIDKCSELDQNIDLSSLNLTALYNCHYLSCVHTVDLSSNNLSSGSLPELHPLQHCQVGGCMEVCNLKLHAFLISALDGAEWSGSCSTYICGKHSLVLFDGMVGKPWLSSP